MAPYLLQWEIIKKAKAAGCKYYDFFGIDEKKWPGVTRFKHGFSGEEIKYPGTFDMIFNLTSYNLYRILRAIRRFV
jgi:lipid II:glycine glycyltransferase (peptidoglycan interpeptide bridge formation enzyme)